MRDVSLFKNEGSSVNTILLGKAHFHFIWSPYRYQVALIFCISKFNAKAFPIQTMPYLSEYTTICHIALQHAHVKNESFSNV